MTMLACPQCKQQYDLPPQATNRDVVCQQCGASFLVLATVPAAAPTQPKAQPPVAKASGQPLAAPAARPPATAKPALPQAARPATPQAPPVARLVSSPASRPTAQQPPRPSAAPPAATPQAKAPLQARPVPSAPMGGGAGQLDNPLSEREPRARHNKKRRQGTPAWVLGSIGVATVTTMGLCVLIAVKFSSGSGSEPSDTQPLAATAAVALSAPVKAVADNTPPKSEEHKSVEPAPLATASEPVTSSEPITSSNGLRGPDSPTEDVSYSLQELTPSLESAAPKAEVAATAPSPPPANQPPVSDVAISPATLAAVKRATVFIRVKHDKGSSSGSGFVISATGDRALIVTNQHVVGRVPEEATDQPGKPFTPRALAAELKQAAIEVVFDSGTPQERMAKAEILGADLVHDLALLQVEGVKDLPAPIDFSHPTTLLETMPVYSFGFPFGEVLATSKGNPAITVGKASISSLRRDDEGKLALVQIDGSINPGNSGGPLVTPDGQLAGVAVATIRNSSGIGLAIPGEQLPPLLAGRCGPAYMVVVHQPDGKSVLRVERWLVDPLHKIRSVKLHYVLADASRSDPKAGDVLEKEAGCQKIDLAIDKYLATADIPLASTGDGKKLFTQAVFTNESGPTVTPVSSYVLKPPPQAPTRAPGVAPGPNRIVIVPPRHRGQRPRIRIIPGGPPPGAPRVPGAPPVVNTRPGDETDILGGGNDARYEEAAPTGGRLVGMDVGLGEFFNSDVIIATRSIFRTGDKVSVSRWHGSQTNRVVHVEAKPGYAIGAITVKAGMGADGCCVTFMRIKGDVLDPDDSYLSDWIGGYGGGGPALMSGGGRPAVALLGRENAQNSTGLGLRFKTTDQPGVLPQTHGIEMPKIPKALANQSMLLGNRGLAHYEDVAPGDNLLVGLDVGVVEAGGNEFIHAVCPIYRSGQKPTLFGRQYGTDFKRVVRLLAKPGYAVGAMTVKTGMNVDGLSLSFMRIDGARLVPEDNYESEWVGDNRPGGQTKLSGEGHPVLGIIGSANERESLGIGLIFYRVDAKR
jgi:S1-C subfamily serine protease